MKGLEVRPVAPNGPRLDDIALVLAEAGDFIAQGTKGIYGLYRVLRLGVPPITVPAPGRTEQVQDSSPVSQAGLLSNLAPTRDGLRFGSHQVSSSCLPIQSVFGFLAPPAQAEVDE